MQQFELSEELVSRIEGLIKADNKECRQVGRTSSSGGYCRNHE